MKRDAAINWLERLIHEPAGPFFHALLQTWVVGDGILMFYAAGEHLLPVWVPMLIVLTWIAACVKLGMDADKRRGIAS